MARVNIDILGISELKWTGMGEFNSDDHYIYYCGQESLRRNGVAIMVNKRVWNAVLGCNLKNDRMISVHLQSKRFNITVIQVYAPASNAEETEVKRFYEDPQDLLELTSKNKVSLGVWLYLWAFYFVPLICISVFVSVPYFLDDCGFVVEPEVRQVDSSSSILLSQDCFGYSRFFVFPYKLWNYLF